MNALLLDLGRHQAWADAEHWRTLERFPAALKDEAIRNRLHHLHFVQSAFSWTVKGDGSPFERTAPADFPTDETLKAYGCRASTDLAALIASATDDMLTRKVAIRWFKDPPLTIAATEALTQAVMHSQWHRGQNASRLRELGGEPTTTDFIFWLWKGRPAAEW
jgi:uncharacterized damage-inducible protein DinB